jgi:protein-tyrosine phosphatase
MGIGRSSLLAAGCLVAQGMPPGEAWAAISDARGLTVPDTPEQRRWLEVAMALG